MGVVFCRWIVVVTFLSKTILVQSTIEVTVAHFRVFRKHPESRHCGVDVLKQNESVGGRISDQTGVCEGLSRTWARNQTIEKGYGYVKKTNVHTTIQQPVRVFAKHWFIPVVLNTGAKVDVHLTTPKDDFWEFDIIFDEVITELPMFAVRFSNMKGIESVEFREAEQFSHWINQREIGYPQISSVRFKVSLVATERNSIQVLLNDEIVERRNLTTLRVNFVSAVSVTSTHRHLNDDKFPVIHGFEFVFSIISF